MKMDNNEPVKNRDLNKGDKIQNKKNGTSSTNYGYSNGQVINIFLMYSGLVFCSKSRDFEGIAYRK